MQSEKPSELLSTACNAARKAYANYSQFVVGAAAQTTDGSVFAAANMENASYGLTICAEVGALQAAMMAGKLAAVVRIAIVGGFIDASRRTRDIVTPCGRCRQLILESAQLGGRDIRVWCADLDLTSVSCFTISELLPHAFGPANLTKDAPL